MPQRVTLAGLLVIVTVYVEAQAFAPCTEAAFAGAGNPIF